MGDWQSVRVGGANFHIFIATTVEGEAQTFESL